MTLRDLIPLRVETRGTGIIFRNGRPVVSDEWVAALTPEQRAQADHALRLHGYRINGNSVEEIPDGNP